MHSIVLKMRTSKAVFAFLTLCMSVMILFPAHSNAEAQLEPLEFVTATGRHVFDVEVARTMEQRTVGLMYRRSMPESQGMLFEFGVEEKVSMWMKNTYIPLDMIFVSKRGRVISIAHDTTPLSEDIISSGKPAYVVIELNGGAAEKIGLKAGDAVKHGIFHP